MAMFDANFLVHLLDAEAGSAKGRVDELASELEGRGESILIPAPALSEYLVRSDEAGKQRLQKMRDRKQVKILPFGEKAAITLATLTREAVEAGDKKAGADQHWQKVKFDRQIVAIAVTEGESVIYSDDDGLRKFAAAAGITALSSDDLPEAHGKCNSRR